MTVAEAIEAVHRTRAYFERRAGPLVRLMMTDKDREMAKLAEEAADVLMAAAIGR